MSVTFRGVRGSAAVSGTGYRTFGGSTMCLEVNAGKHRVIVDAGSGLRQLGLELHERQVAETHILLTHYHLDHVIA